MSSKSQTENSPTTPALHHFENYVIDMRTAEFRSTVDVGQTRIGTVTCRAMWHQGSEWATFVNLADDPALDAGGLEADDFLAQFLAEPGMADAVAKVRRKVGEAQASEVGCGLAALRLKAGLSQKELGQRMGKLQPAIARWERNPSQMQMENAMAYCDAIGITMQEFHDAIRQTKDQTAAA